MAELIFLILLGLSGGVLLGINRALIGRLGSDLGAAPASVVNHLGGLLFMLLILIMRDGSIDFKSYLIAPKHAYVGGIVGAMFVAIISWIIPKIGVMKTSLLLISGQMMMGFGLDLFSGRVQSFSTGLMGLFLILCGVFIGEYRKFKYFKRSL